MARPVGKTLADLPVGWQEQIVSMMSEGMGQMEMLKNMGISRHYHDKWMREEPEYQQVISDAWTMAEAWYEKQGRENITNKSFNTTLFIFMTTTKFRWDDGRFTNAKLKQAELELRKQRDELVPEGEYQSEYARQH